MSAEIAGFESRDNQIVAQATLTAAAIQVETGTPPDMAYTNRGAEYAVMLTLVALRHMGIVNGYIDVEEFNRRIHEVEVATIPRAHITTFQKEEG